jgi:hypothetical protein
LWSHLPKQTRSVNVGTLGAGGATRLSAELFKLMAGIDIAIIPYKGGSLKGVFSGNQESSFALLKINAVTAAGVNSKALESYAHKE